MDLVMKMWNKRTTTFSFQIYTNKFLGVGIELESFNMKENGIHLVLPFINISFIWFIPFNGPIENGNKVETLIQHPMDEKNIAPVGAIGSTYDCNKDGCMVEFKSKDSITSFYYYYGEIRRI